MADKLLLIDGHSILNRAFYGLPDMTNSEGVHTNAVLGFLKIMLNVIEEESADYCVVAFDVKAPTFRHKVYSEYKGTRKPAPEEFRQQVPLIKEVLNACGITIVELPGFEADDIIGTLGKRYEREGFKVTVLSGDRDLLQLADDNIMIRMPKTSKGVTQIYNYYGKDVMEQYGVTPEEFIDLKALMGDSSDNIKGAPGIGEKTALSLIQRFHSIDEIYKRIDEVTPPKAKKSMEENVEDIKLSRFLVTINTDAPVEIDIANCKITNIFTSEAYDIFVRLGFKSMLSYFDGNIENNKKADIINSTVWVTDFNEVMQVFEKAFAAKLVGVSMCYEQEELKGVSLCLGKDENYYIPVMLFCTQELLMDNVSRLCLKTQTSFCDIKEQLYFIPEYDSSKMFDCAVAAYLINPLKDKYNSDDYALQYLGEELVSNIKDVVSESINLAYVAYMCKDKMTDILKSEGMYTLYTDMEYPLIYVLYEMQLEGIRVDKQALKEYGDNLVEQIKVIEQDIYNLCQMTFNINSPKQLGEVLFEKLGIEGGKKTKTGYSTSADILEKLSDKHEVIPKILEYRQLTKLNSTYAQGLAAYIKDDGRIHGKLNQTITATGRISSTEPNLQNIPVRMELGRLIRKVFIPKDGCVFVDADYSQIELRIMAHMSKDENLINAYNEAKDVHSITASQVFGIPLEQVTSTQRRNAKAVNFGIIYGISSFGLSQDLSISRKEANEYIEGYFKSYPGVKRYLDEVVAFAKENGYSLTLYNRKRPIPELKSSNFMQRSFGERVAMNSPIQGTAADIMKIAMINVHKRLKKEGLRSKLILQIHDELLVEAYEDEVCSVKDIIEEEMINAAKLSVKLEVEANTGKDWFEVK